jgi:hypothetical protein
MTNMKTVKIEPTGKRELRAPDQQHRLVFGGSNMNTVIHLTDGELSLLRQALADYEPRSAS